MSDPMSLPNLVSPVLVSYALPCPALPSPLPSTSSSPPVARRLSPVACRPDTRGTYRCTTQSHVRQQPLQSAQDPTYQHLHHVGLHRIMSATHPIDPPNGRLEKRGGSAPWARHGGGSSACARSSTWWRLVVFAAMFASLLGLWREGEDADGLMAWVVTKRRPIMALRLRWRPGFGFGVSG